MAKLHGLFPAIIPNYALIFCLRFDLLVYRARLVWITDSFRLAQYLAGLEDASHEVQRLANVLRGNAMAEALQYFAYIQQSIAVASAAPCLEVEFRLVQLMLQQIADGVLRELPGAGGSLDPGSLWTHLSGALSDDPGSPAGYAKTENSLGDLGFFLGKKHSEDSVKTAITLCKTYPGTAGRFLPIATTLKDDVTGPDLKNVSRTYSIATRSVEKAWGGYILGRLEMCERRHPFSKGSFPEGCPECGRKAELPDAEFAKNAEFLQEDKFLEQMRRCGLS